MISRYRISVGGVQMDSLDDNLLILDISYAPPERDVRQITNANLHGYDVGEEKILRRTVGVTFELHIYDIAERNAVCQLVNDWADKGGNLITNDREGQRLTNVICDQYADIESAKNWTDPLTIVFTTTYNPYWVSNTEVTRTLVGKNVSGTLTLDGNTGSSLISVTATAQASVTSFKATIGTEGDKDYRVIELTGLSISSGQQIVIDYLRNRYMRIRANGSNVMAKLKPTSSDNLKMECGKTKSIGIVSDGKVSAVFKARGCWR